jgi:hypothetical protein
MVKMAEKGKEEQGTVWDERTCFDRSNNSCFFDSSLLHCFNFLTSKPAALLAVLLREALDSKEFVRERELCLLLLSNLSIAAFL